MPRRFHVLCLSLVASLCCGGEPAAPDEAQLKRWTAELGSDNYDTREAAQEKLRLAGDIAELALEAVKKSGDVEVCTRAEQILSNIYPQRVRKREMQWLADNVGTLFGADLKAPFQWADKTVETPLADRNFLGWLAEVQEADGHWNSVRHGASKDADIEQSAMALLAFLGAGHTEKVGEYKKNVKLAVAWLRTRVGEDGGIRREDETEVDGIVHSVAGMALAEAAGMANIAATKELAQKVVDYSCAKHQAGDAENPGGFGRAPKSTKPDMVTTLFFTMQLKSAKVAGLKVPMKSFDGLIAFLDTLDKQEKGFAFAPGLEPSARATIYGCLCRQFLGWRREDLASRAGLFAKQYGDPNGKGSDDMTDWIAQMALFQQGGDIWHAFNNGVKKRIGSTQLQHNAPNGPVAPRGEWTGAGRVFSTALGALCLEVYYRYRLEK